MRANVLSSPIAFIFPHAKMLAPHACNSAGFFPLKTKLLLVLPYAKSSLPLFDYLCTYLLLQKIGKCNTISQTVDMNDDQFQLLAFWWKLSPMLALFQLFSSVLFRLLYLSEFCTYLPYYSLTVPFAIILTCRIYCAYLPYYGLIVPLAIILIVKFLVLTCQINSLTVPLAIIIVGFIVLTFHIYTLTMPLAIILVGFIVLTFHIYTLTVPFAIISIILVGFTMLTCHINSLYCATCHVLAGVIAKFKRVQLPRYIYMVAMFKQIYSAGLSGCGCQPLIRISIVVGFSGKKCAVPRLNLGDKK